MQYNTITEIYQSNPHTWFTIMCIISGVCIIILYGCTWTSADSPDIAVTQSFYALNATVIAVAVILYGVEWHNDQFYKNIYLLPDTSKTKIIGARVDACMKIDIGLHIEITPGKSKSQYKHDKHNIIRLDNYHKAQAYLVELAHWYKRNTKYRLPDINRGLDKIGERLDKAERNIHPPAEPVVSASVPVEPTEPVVPASKEKTVPSPERKVTQYIANILVRPPTVTGIFIPTETVFESGEMSDVDKIKYGRAFCKLYLRLCELRKLLWAGVSI